MARPLRGEIGRKSIDENTSGLGAHHTGSGGHVEAGGCADSGGIGISNSPDCFWMRAFMSPAARRPSSGIAADFGARDSPSTHGESRWYFRGTQDPHWAPL